MIVHAGRKFTLDTNLYIRAFRDVDSNNHLQLFHTAFAPFEYLTAVVAQELTAGATNAQSRKQLQRHLFDPFESRRRLITPSYNAWKQAGQTLARLSKKEGLEIGRVSKGFANDVLLAHTCREAGVTLVTENVHGFERIAKVVELEFVEPWPAL